MRGIVRAWGLFQFELFVALLCMISGLPLAFGVAPSPNSAIAVMPTWTFFAWGVFLSLGGFCTVTGILWRYIDKRQFMVGLLIEKAGLFMLMAECLVLAIAVVYYAHGPGSLQAGILVALVLACWSRIRTINKEASIVKEHGEE